MPAAETTAVAFHTFQGGFWNWSWLLSWFAAGFSQCDYYQDMVAGTPYYIYSPNYPDPYGSGTQCRWYAVAPPGTTIALDCDDVNIPLSESCGGDRLAVSHTGDLHLRDVMNYCGTGTLHQRSVANKMNIVLFTTPNTPGGYFSCRILAAFPVATVQPPTEPPPVGGGCECGWRNKNRIVGGSETGVNEFPMMAGLVDGNLRSLYCGATIVSLRYVVTAAHCLVRRTPPEVAVLVGEHDVSTGTDTDAVDLILASQFVLYPTYAEATQTNDIALVRTSRDIVFRNAVGPACLPFRYKSSSFEGQTVTALGWGLIFFGGPTSDALKQTQLKVISLSDCSEALPDDPITDKQMCTYTPNTDTCQADSGGPLLWTDPGTGRLHLAGVISYGIGCAADKPGVNTRVAAYLDWIQQTTLDSYCVP